MEGVYGINQNKLENLSKHTLPGWVYLGNESTGY